MFILHGTLKLKTVTTILLYISIKKRIITPYYFTDGIIRILTRAPNQNLIKIFLTTWAFSISPLLLLNS